MITKTTILDWTLFVVILAVGFILAALLPMDTDIKGSAETIYSRPASSTSRP